MPAILPRVPVIAVLLLLGACKSTESSGPAHQLAQQCVAIKAHDSDRFLLSDGDTRYRFAEADVGNAEPFFVKPSRLGTFLLYDSERRYLGSQLIRVTRESAPSRRTEWNIHGLTLRTGNRISAETFTLTNIVDNLYLQAGKSGPILKAHPDNIPLAAAFDLVPLPAELCSEFPEASLDAEVADDFYDPKPDDAPVTGFVDLHTHLGFPKAMASLAMAGDLFHPYGIEHALKDCAHLHGKDGLLDLLESERANEGEPGHATAGYPDFEYWPRRDTSTHVQAYYKWLQRG